MGKKNKIDEFKKKKKKIFIMDKSQIERKLAKRIRHIIKKIEKSYGSIYSYTDGCDEYGFIKYYECKNGFHGESWEVKTACRNSIIAKKNNLINNGIMFNGKKYYIHSDFYNKDYYDKNLIKIISKEEHDKLLEISKIINYIISAMKNEIEEYGKRKDIESIRFILHSNIMYDAKKILNFAPKHNFEDFIKYLKSGYNYYNHKSSELLLNILNLDKFKNERQILGLGTELIK